MSISLNGTWQLHFTHPETHQLTTIPAQVPGNVLGDLQRAKLIPDPYFGTNSWETRPWEFVDWEYSTEFETPSLAAGEKAELVFGGVDTVFDLFVNGQKIGSGKNMFIEHRFDVTQVLRKDAVNTLSVKIVSSLQYARNYKRPALVMAQKYNFENLGVRRAAHTYGWDIAPRLVGAGLWRDVRLEVIPASHWEDVYCLVTRVLEKKAHLELQWNFETPERVLDGFHLELEMACGDSQLKTTAPLHYVSGVHFFEIADPKLWWPLGSGEQPLYNATLKLFNNGILCDTRCFRIGIREIQLERTENNLDGNGKFLFYVNHRPIFIKGSNWVPANAIHGEHPERVVSSLELFKELGCNMIRCWGGNVYEDHDFFDWCDENGLLVWQDFMIACMTPRQDPEFLDELRNEATSVIRHLRQHTSLALWAGDNECDDTFFGDRLAKWMTSDNLTSRQVFRRAVFENDPIRDYLPSSPYLSDELKRLNRRYASPEQHLWGPRDNWKNPFYRNNTAIFASEIGYHGMTSLESMKKYLPAESLDARSAEDPNWLCHAAQPYGDEPDGGWFAYRIKLMRDQVEGYFGTMPEKLEDYIEASQIVQAEALKYFVESFRMAKWKKTGLLWWNVIDCWPQFSDAVVDYYGDKKLAFFYLKNVQKPLQLFFDEPEDWCIRLRAVSDLQRPTDVTYRVTDFSTGEEIMAGTVHLEKDSAREVEALKINQSTQRILKIDFEYDGVKGVNHYIEGNAPIPFTFYHAWYEEAKRIYR